METFAPSVECNDFDQMCRVCLKKTELTVEVSDVAEMIAYCTNDKVPHFIFAFDFDPKQVRFVYSGDSGEYFYAKGDVSRMLPSVGDFVPFQATMEQILRSINGSTEFILFSVGSKRKTKDCKSTRTMFRLWKSVPLLRLLEDAHANAS